VCGMLYTEYKNIYYIKSFIITIIERKQVHLPQPNKKYVKEVKNKMTIQELDLNKILIILFVGTCAVIGVYYQIGSIPELCLGGLIGYLSKDYTQKKEPTITTQEQEITEYDEQ
jgi:hypothetical protein